MINKKIKATQNNILLLIMIFFAINFKMFISIVIVKLTIYFVILLF